MNINLDKMLERTTNKYQFTRAAMLAIDKVANIKDYPHENGKKVVANVLNLILDNKIKYNFTKIKE